MPQPNCPKCAGYLIVDHMIDMVVGTWLPVVRCLNCGYVSSPTMATNRAAPHEPLTKLGRRKSHRKAKSIGQSLASQP